MLLILDRNHDEYRWNTRRK